MITDGSGTSDSDAGTTVGDTGGSVAGSAAAGQPQIGTITGYFEMPLRRVVQVCSDNPDRNVSDVLEEERENGGSSNN